MLLVKNIRTQGTHESLRMPQSYVEGNVYGSVLINRETKAKTTKMLLYSLQIKIQIITIKKFLKNSHKILPKLREIFL